MLIQAVFDAQQGLITEAERNEITDFVNGEITGIIECGRILNQLKKED